MSDRTELEWSYTPSDFLEASVECESAEYQIQIADGKVTAKIPGTSLASELQAKISQRVKMMLQTRQMQTSNPFQMDGPRTTLFNAETKHRTIVTASGHLTLAGLSLDMVITNAKGEPVIDTKAERIGRETTELKCVGAESEAPETLARMLDSFSRSIQDPENALVHLYEIRDALATEFGGEAAAKATLGISSADWSRMGQLANHEPLDQSRHRGKHSGGTRPATADELRQGRQIASRWIRAFMNSNAK